MNANEIRVGQTYKLNGVFKTLSFSDFSDFSYLCENLEPIKTTDKRLLEVGFEIHNRTVPFFTHPKLPIQIRFSKRNGVQMRIAYTKIGDWKHFPYLHQIQSLYFSYNGEDLVFSTEP